MKAHTIACDLFDIVLKRLDGTQTTRRGKMAAKQVDDDGRIYGHRTLIKNGETIVGASYTEIAQAKA